VIAIILPSDERYLLIDGMLRRCGGACECDRAWASQVDLGDGGGAAFSPCSPYTYIRLLLLWLFCVEAPFLGGASLRLAFSERPQARGHCSRLANSVPTAHSGPVAAPGRAAAQRDKYVAISQRSTPTQRVGFLFSIVIRRE
jgi:hypothetical protein